MARLEGQRDIGSGAFVHCDTDSIFFVGALAEIDHGVANAVQHRRYGTFSKGSPQYPVLLGYW